MDFTITTQEKEIIPFSVITPPGDSPVLIPGAKCLDASGHFGSIRFFDVACEGFNIWYSNYHTTRRTYMHAMMDSPMLRLHFAINNTIHYELEGLSEITFLQDQFNLSYVPFVKNTAWFSEDQVYTTFNIHFTIDYLQHFASHFPLLDAFLQKVQLGAAVMLSRQHGQMTHEMSALIRRILRCRYEGDIRNLYLQAKVQELLLLALEQIGAGEGKAADIVLRPYDIEKIREAHDYLLSNMENPCTLIELSHKVGINDFKLKKGFKKIYGTTVYDFLLDARMEKAKKLLLETDTSVHEIAIITGYKNLSSFITAFKKKMGYSPGSFKRMKRI